MPISCLRGLHCRRRQIVKLWPFGPTAPTASKLSVSVGGDGMMRKLRMWAKSVCRSSLGRNKTSFFTPSCLLGLPSQGTRRRAAGRSSSTSFSVSWNYKKRCYDSTFYWIQIRIRIRNRQKTETLNPDPDTGCQFNWLKDRLKNRLKNHLRCKFDSATCLNYPFLEFFQYRESQVVFKRFFSQLNWHPVLWFHRMYKMGNLGSKWLETAKLLQLSCL